MVISTTWSSDAVEFSTDVRQAIQEATEKLGYSKRVLYSGPGHDATYMSQMTNTGMIFVKSVNGMSHNEQEYTPDEDIVKGANTLLYTTLKLANEENCDDQKILYSHEIVMNHGQK